MAPGMAKKPTRKRQDFSHIIVEYINADGCRGVGDVGVLLGEARSELARLKRLHHKGDCLRAALLAAGLYEALQQVAARVLKKPTSEGA